MILLGVSLSLFQLDDTCPPAWGHLEGCSWATDSLTAPTPPTTRERERGLLGVGAMPRLPSRPPSQGTGHPPPNSPATEQSPAWPLGPADPSSIPPGLGESPWLAHCPTPATFPLPHCSRYQHPPRSAAAQESVTAAGAAAEAGLRGPGVLLAGAATQAGLPEAGPRVLTAAACWSTWHMALLSLGILVLYG